VGSRRGAAAPRLKREVARELPRKQMHMALCCPLWSVRSTLFTSSTIRWTLSKRPSGDPISPEFPRMTTLPPVRGHLPRNISIQNHGNRASLFRDCLKCGMHIIPCHCTRLCSSPRTRALRTAARPCSRAQAASKSRPATSCCFRTMAAVKSEAEMQLSVLWEKGRPLGWECACRRRRVMMTLYWAVRTVLPT
jgi:hypothetical protein